MIIRNARPVDASAITALRSAYWGEDDGARAFNEADIANSWLAVEGGAIRGYAYAHHDALHPTFCWIGVEVGDRPDAGDIQKALLDQVIHRADRPVKTAVYRGASIESLLRDHGLEPVMVCHLASLPAANFAAAAAIGESRLKLSDARRLSSAQRDQLAMLHGKLYAQTHRFDPPIEEPLVDLKSVYLGADFRPDLCQLCWAGEAMVGVASVREEDGDYALGWCGLDDAYAAQRPLLRDMVSTVLHQAYADGATQVAGEFDSVVPDAMMILDSFDWQQRRYWVTWQQRAG